MFLKSKFLGVALATCVAVPVVAFANAPDCASAEVEKALQNNHRVKQALQVGMSMSFSDFKTLSKSDKDKLADCQCTAKVKVENESQTFRTKFSAEYNGYKEVVVDTEDMFKDIFGEN